MIEKNKDFAPEFTENVSDEAVVIFSENHPEQENKESRKDRGKAPGGNGAYLCFFICSNGLSGTCCISCRCGLLQKLRWFLPQPEDDYAVTVMSGKTEEDASEEKHAENDTNQIQDVSKQEKSPEEQLERNASVTPKITQEAADTEISDETGNSWQDSESDFANEAEAGEQTETEEPEKRWIRRTFSQEADERK